MTARNEPGSTGRVRVAVVYGGRKLGARDLVRFRRQHPAQPSTRSGSKWSPVGITPGGSWVLTDGRPETLAITDGQLPEVTGDVGHRARTASRPGSRRATAVARAGAGRLLAAVDVVFPVLHGPYGEDGTIQGLLELAGVPYVGAGVLASAAGMDKEFTKKLLAAEGLPIGDQVVLRPQQATRGARGSRAPRPAGVRQARPRRSRRIGVSRVTAWDQLPRGDRGRRAGTTPKVIVEAAMPGRELECGVLELPGRPDRSQHSRRDPGRGVRGREDAFYDFDTEYLDDAAELDVPAKIDDDVADDGAAVGDSARSTPIDCQGLARVDFFLTDDGPVINEINTMPGFTTISMYPRMWAASGVDYPTLLATMVDTAVKRGTGLR